MRLGIPADFRLPSLNFKSEGSFRNLSTCSSLSMLPGPHGGGSDSSVGSSLKSSMSKVGSALFRRRFIWHPNQMDFEYAFWQMFYLPFDPHRVYRTALYHMQTKKQWARDDPAFLVILFCFICVSSFSFALAFYADSFFIMVRIITWTVFVDLVLTGLAVSFVGYHLANRLFVQTGNKKMEFLYCFDIHCNAWYCMFFYTYVAQYVLLPVLLTGYSWLSTVLANALYAAAFIHYTYITVLGYSSIPNAKKTTNVLLVPLILILGVLAVLTLMRFNVTIAIMNMRYAGWQIE